MDKQSNQIAAGTFKAPAQSNTRALGYRKLASNPWSQKECSPGSWVMAVFVIMKRTKNKHLSMSKIHLAQCNMDLQTGEARAR